MWNLIKYIALYLKSSCLGVKTKLLYKYHFQFDYIATTLLTSQYTLFKSLRCSLFHAIF